jgi:hypothetical protein
VGGVAAKLSKRKGAQNQMSLTKEEMIEELSGKRHDEPRDCVPERFRDESSPEGTMDDWTDEEMQQYDSCVQRIREHVAWGLAHGIKEGPLTEDMRRLLSDRAV